MGVRKEKFYILIVPKITVERDKVVVLGPASWLFGRW